MGPEDWKKNTLTSFEAGRSSREPREEPEGRQGGPWDLETPREGTPSSFASPWSSWPSSFWLFPGLPELRPGNLGGGLKEMRICQKLVQTQVEEPKILTKKLTEIDPNIDPHIHSNSCKHQQYFKTVPSSLG